MAKKHATNPLIEPESIKPSREGYRVKGTFNAGAAEYNREIILLLASTGFERSLPCSKKRQGADIVSGRAV